MRHIINELASTTNLEDITLSLGCNSSPWLIIDILKTIKIKELTIIYNLDEQKESINSEIAKIKYNENYNIPVVIKFIDREKEFDEINKDDVQNFVFDAPDSEKILIEEIERFKPRQILGVLNGLEFSKYKIWELARKFADKIYVISWKIDFPDEIMDWNRCKNNNIELSIIFPMYNVEKYLKECIESVIKWQAEFVEFLFVDDGSPDNCAKIISDYSKKDSRVKLLSKVNGGCASARQYGLEEAKGRYIGFVDPDDFVDSTMFEKLLSRAIEGSYQISYCGYNEYYENTKTIKRIEDNLYCPYCFGTYDKAKINELVAYLRVAIWRGIYSRDLIELAKIKFYEDLKRFDDLPFKVEIFTAARSVVAVPEHLYYYRLERPGQDVAADDERLYVHFDIFEHLNDSIIRSASKDVLEYMLICKLHTHMFAIEKLQNQYKKEYIKRAKEDLLSMMEYRVGMEIIGKLGGEADRKFYKKICNG